MFLLHLMFTYYWILGDYLFYSVVGGGKLISFFFLFSWGGGGIRCFRLLLFINYSAKTAECFWISSLHHNDMIIICFFCYLHTHTHTHTYIYIYILIFLDRFTCLYCSYQSASAIIFAKTPQKSGKSQRKSPILLVHQAIYMPWLFSLLFS